MKAFLKEMFILSCNYTWNCPPGSIPYTIRPGDTLYGIARMYDTTAERLMEVNPDADPYNLTIGSIICVPLPLQDYPFCRTTNYYVVDDDETIYSIAKFFGVSEEQLLYSNMGISPENIYKGMILCIPIAKPPLCIKLSCGKLTLEYPSGEEESFDASCRASFSSTVVQKQLDTPVSGGKRLNLSNSACAICNQSGKRNPGDIVLSDSDMDYVFNRTVVGTEVN